MRGIKKSVAVVLINEKNQVLMVSRKDDHEDFGLVGGKVDPEDNDNVIYAAIRETLEETGLIIKNLELILVYPEGTRLSYTFLADYQGEIHTNEPHVVKWGSYDDMLANSTFREYNLLVKKSLDWLEIDLKVKDEL